MTGIDARRDRRLKQLRSIALVINPIADTPIPRAMLAVASVVRVYRQSQLVLESGGGHRLPDHRPKM